MCECRERSTNARKPSKDQSLQIAWEKTLKARQPWRAYPPHVFILLLLFGMLNYCVRSVMGTPLFGLPSVRLLFHTPFAETSAAVNTPWAPSTASDIGARLADGFYGAYVRVAVDMPTTPHVPRPSNPLRPRLAVVSVRQGVARMLVMGTGAERAYYQKRGHVLFVVLQRITRYGAPIHTRERLHQVASAWFTSRPRWWAGFLPHVFAMMQREWSLWSAPPDEDVPERQLDYCLTLIANALASSSSSPPAPQNKEHCVKRPPLPLAHAVVISLIG